MAESEERMIYFEEVSNAKTLFESLLTIDQISEEVKEIIKEPHEIVKQMKENPKEVNKNVIKLNEKLLNIIDNEILIQIQRKEKFGSIHIANNIKTLEKWSEKKFDKVLYNSSSNGKASEIFRSKIMNHSNLFFIVIDKNNNVFGHFHPSTINEVLPNNNYDSNIFMFILYNNGRSGVKKYNNIGNDRIFTGIYNSNNYYYCRSEKKNTYYDGYEINSKNNISWIGYTINTFKEEDNTIFTGDMPNEDGFVAFYLKKLIVVEMREKNIEEMKEETEKRKREEEERKRKEESIEKLRLSLSNNLHIIDNISKLEEWSESEFNQVLYNSTTDGNTSEIFRNKIMNHSKLYFIVIDENDNVFGHYHPSLIQKGNELEGRWINFDKNIFMFTLYSNGRRGVEKYSNIGDVGIRTLMYSDTDFYNCRSINADGYQIMSPEGEHKSYVFHVTSRFSAPDKRVFTGGQPDSRGWIPFNWKELIVIEMK